MNGIRKALILAGGWGTRFLPFTKVVPKELLPVNGIPAIHYVVAESIAAGIEEIIIVTRPGCTLTRRYFEDAPLLDRYLQSKQAATARAQIDLSAIHSYLRFEEEQPHSYYGSAIPLLQLRDELEAEANFAILFADELVFGGPSALAELMAAFRQHRPTSIVAMQHLPHKRLSDFGNLKLGKQLSPRWPACFPVYDLIQRPKPVEIQSNYAVISRLLLTPDIFTYLDQLAPNDELDLGEAISRQASTQSVIGVAISGQWATVGDPENYRATLNLAATLQ